MQNFHGVKLSVFTHGVKLSAVSNCPFCTHGVKLSAVSNWPRCRLVCGVKLSAVSIYPVINCPRCQIVCGVKLSAVSNYPAINCPRCQIVLLSNCPPTPFCKSKQYFRFSQSLLFTMSPQIRNYQKVWKVVKLKRHTLHGTTWICFVLLKGVKRWVSFCYNSMLKIQTDLIIM